MTSLFIICAPHSFVSGKIMRKLVSVLAIWGLSWMANSHVYIVEAKLYQQDKLISSPTLMVNENEIAEIAVDTLANNYQLNITLNEIDDNSVRITTNIRMGDQAIAPAMHVNYGEEASIIIEQEKLSLTVLRAETNTK